MIPRSIQHFLFWESGQLIWEASNILMCLFIFHCSCKFPLWWHFHFSCSTYRSHFKNLEVKKKQKPLYRREFCKRMKNCSINMGHDRFVFNKTLLLHFRVSVPPCLTRFLIPQNYYRQNPIEKNPKTSPPSAICLYGLNRSLPSKESPARVSWKPLTKPRMASRSFSAF